jgi:hypothetical protein
MIERAVFSLWTRPPSFQIRRGPLLVATLAHCLAALHFQEVHFVTDRRGAAISAALGWRFTNLSEALEQLDAPAEVWAAGKLEALRLQESPAVHVDQDVFLLGGLADFLDAPLLAQSPDRLEVYQRAEARGLFDLVDLQPGFVPVNAGVIGGANLAAVREFAELALEKIRRFHGQPFGGTWPSMICEQYFFAQFAADRGLELRTLFGSDPTREQLAALPYVHLTGEAKLQPFYLERVETRLSRDFPAQYAAFLAGWEALPGKAPELQECCGCRGF